MTGSLQIKKRKSGEIYYAVLNLGQNNYKWINLHLPVKNNKKEAQKRLNELLVEFNQPYMKNGQVKFTDYAMQWLNEVHDKIDVVTYDGYKNYLLKHILPYFEPKNLSIKDVTVADIEEYYNYKAQTGRLDGKKGGLSLRSIKLHGVVINRIFDDAFCHDLIKNNPCERARYPKIEKKASVGNFYSVEQCQEILKILKEKNSPVYEMMYITVMYGLRRSELLGLKWDAIDFEKGFIEIKHTVVNTVEKVVAKDKTKNKSSNRLYPLLDEIRELLLKLKAKQEQNKKFLQTEYYDTGYVFTREDGRMHHPQYPSQMFKKIIGKTDLPLYRWHDLRHSTASILLAKGWSMKDVSEWLGHSGISITMNIYTHVDLNRKRELSHSIQGMLISC